MFKRECKICGKTNDLNILHIPVEGEEPDTFSVFVCHMCWDIIANVAVRALDERIKMIEKILVNK